MKRMHIPADDLRVGDFIVHNRGEIDVRELDRTQAPKIVTNPGARVRDRRRLAARRNHPRHLTRARPDKGGHRHARPCSPGVVCTHMHNGR